MDDEGQYLELAELNFSGLMPTHGYIKLNRCYD